MQRIKLNVFKSWFDKNLTGKEIDFLLVLSFYQDKRGVTRGVYYKDMMREGKMSAQTFYDCKKCRRNKIKDPDAKEQEKIEKVLENREKEVLNQFVNLSDIIRSMIETINEKIPDPRKWNRRLKATLFIKKFNEAVS